MDQTHAQHIPIPGQHGIDIASSHAKVLKTGVDDRYAIHSLNSPDDDIYCPCSNFMMLI